MIKFIEVLNADGKRVYIAIDKIVSITSPVLGRTGTTFIAVDHPVNSTIATDQDYRGIIAKINSLNAPADDNFSDNLDCKLSEMMAKDVPIGNGASTTNPKPPSAE